ncbi:MAG: glycosyltransferase family A protein [Candidatus Paceibacterota bacterium]
MIKYKDKYLIHMEQKQLFFSIIIPAHNEEKYITETLTNIRDLDYPAERFEVFVIENGSNDKTYEVAGKNKGQNIEVFSSPIKGVSSARNFGIRKIRRDSDWTIFLDADTLLKSGFLRDLNISLQRHQDKNFVVGTTSLEPLPETKTAKRWFVFWDICHKLFKVSYSIQIIKSSLLGNIKYDESLEMGEDLKIIKEARRFGKFFFFKTSDVHTSIRRFEQVGWWKIFFQWTIVANLPHFLQKKAVYKVTR